VTHEMGGTWILFYIIDKSFWRGLRKNNIQDEFIGFIF
jgi:hypothetical protein